jgi:hypothetical protein
MDKGIEKIYISEKYTVYLSLLMRRAERAIKGNKTLASVHEA